MAEKVREFKGGPGARGRGPRPKLDNPGALFARIIKYIAKNYLIQLILVVVCIFITVLSSVQGTMFTQSLIDDYIIPLMGQSDPDYSGLAHAIANVAVFYGCGVLSAYGYTRLMVNVTGHTEKPQKRYVQQNGEPAYQIL